MNTPRWIATVLAGGVAAALLVTTGFAAPPNPGADGLRHPLAAPHSDVIPAFSRKYGTSCSTCHITPGKLNAEGEAFRLNGYRFPVGDEEVREEDPVPLGADPWRDLWPEAIWPGAIPGALPLAFHLTNDVRVSRRVPGDGLTASYRFPASVHLLAGTTLGGGIAAFLDVGWRPDVGVQLNQAKVKIQDVISFLPPRALNVWVGAQNPHLLTLGDPSLDRSAHRPFLWRRLSLGDWELEDRATGEVLISESRFRLGAARPTIELNGLVGGRLHYGLGLAQPSSSRSDGETHASDLYVKLRYKLGGFGLDGRPPSRGEPMAWGGQLLDEGVTVEHFAYFGETDLVDGGSDRHRSFGFALRAVKGRTDLGIGHIRGQNSRPWGVTELGARRSSTFARAEYLFFPWLIGSAKVDRTEFRAVSSSQDEAGFPPLQRTRVLPGLVVLVHANVRVVMEGEIFLRDRPRSGAGGERPHALWLSLDVGF
jgi:hypothetical protein